MTRKLPKVNLPREIIKRLPHNGVELGDKHLVFTFTCFDRTHELFNLSGDGDWFLDLLDCFKSVSGKTIEELKKSLHDLHPVDWNNANVASPDDDDQRNYWQFRLNKSKGRVIGFIVHTQHQSLFYVVWMDRHHNLTNSAGYGGVNKFRTPLSGYELQEDHISELENELDGYKTIFETEVCKSCGEKLLK